MLELVYSHLTSPDLALPCKFSVETGFAQFVVDQEHGEWMQMTEKHHGVEVTREVVVVTKPFMIKVEGYGLPFLIGDFIVICPELNEELKDLRDDEPVQ